VDVQEILLVLTLHV